ncbi:hypothetical protein D3C85_929810 [compost metagenome]
MGQVVQVEGATEVVAHQEDVVHVLLGRLIIDLGNLVTAGADGRSELILASGLGLQLVEHGAQFLHQHHIGGAIARTAQAGVGALAARELPVDVHAVEELPGLQELLDRGDEGVALGLVPQEVEGIGEGPPPDRGQDLEVRTGLLERHQVAEVALVGLIPGAEVALGHLDRRPGIVDGHLEVLATGTGALQRLEAAGDLFEAVVDAVAAADGGEAIEDVSQVLGRDLVDGELATIDPPFHVVGTHHLAGLVGVGLVVLLQRCIERRQMAAVGIGNHQFLLVGERAAVGVAQGHLHLVAPPLGHLEVGGTRGGSRT